MMNGFAYFMRTILGLCSWILFLLFQQDATKRIEGSQNLLTALTEWKFYTFLALRLCRKETVHCESHRLSLLIEAASYL